MPSKRPLRRNRGGDRLISIPGTSPKLPLRNAMPPGAAGHVRCKRWLGDTRQRLASTAAKVDDQRDDRAPKAHSCADQMHNIHGANVCKAWAAEHAEKAHDAKCAENEEDANGCGAIVHGISFSRVCLSCAELPTCRLMRQAALRNGQLVSPPNIRPERIRKLNTPIPDAKRRPATSTSTEARQKATASATPLATTQCLTADL